MKALVQRVSSARVVVDAREVSAIGPGLLVLLGVADGDGPEQADRLADKVRALRVFEDADGKMNEALGEREVLCVSQFTLLADTTRQKGTRPDFSGAAPKEQAEPLYERFCQTLRDLGVPVSTGVFGARMAVELVNDGPVTLLLEA